MYYIHRPSPETIATAAKEFALKLGIESNDRLDRVKARVDDAHEKAEIDGGDPVAVSKMVAEAEAAYDAVEQTHVPVCLKFAWEKSEKWREGALAPEARRNGIEVASTWFKPWEHAPGEWAACFTPRQNKPAGY